MTRPLRALRWLFVLCAALSATPLQAGSGAPTEQQVKAVFVFNFTHFTEWPAASFASAGEPLVIGVLGSDDFAAQLDDVVRGEQVGGHPLQVRRLQGVEDIGDCHILYVDRSAAERLTQALGQLGRRGTLTVSDVDGASRLGAMIELARSGNRIQLLINVDSARAAGLTLSSKLLRPARIVRTERG